jgi:uncharacterized membrane protein
MTRGRLEAFSDGVLAILITIMVLELRIPHGADIKALREVLPEFLTYVMSFVFLGIYWSNHHHMFHLVDRVSGGILMANLHLLFWLSLVPVTTAWVGKNPTVPLPTAVYSFVFLLSGIAWQILQDRIIAQQGPHSRLRDAIQNDFKGRISTALYAGAVALAFVRPWIAQVILVLVAAMWFIPDRRFESHVG